MGHAGPALPITDITRENKIDFDLPLDSKHQPVNTSPPSIEPGPSMDELSSFPPGIKKIELGTVLITFLEDKLFIASKGSEEHITIHFGTNSKVLDVHRTRRTTGGREEHTTLFTVPHDQLSALVESIARELLQTYRSIFRPLRVGWMARNHLFAESEFFPEKEALPLITKVEKKRLKVDESKLLTRLGKLEKLHDLFDLPSGQCFSLISIRSKHRARIIGFGFKLCRADGRSRLLWCSDRRFHREMRALFGRFFSRFSSSQGDALPPTEPLPKVHSRSIKK